jgi:hypothetical protein
MEYIEIEFVCVNTTNDTATPLVRQIALLTALKKLRGVLPYRQDWSEMMDDGEQQISLAVIITDKINEKQLINEVKLLSKQYGVGIDLIGNVSESKIAEIMSGNLEFQMRDLT